MPRRFDAAAPDFERQFVDLLSEKREAQADVRDAVADILADVRARGDAALLAYTERFDRLCLTADRLRVGAEEVAAARAAVISRWSARGSSTRRAVPGQPVTTHP